MTIYRARNITGRVRKNQSILNARVKGRLKFFFFFIRKPNVKFMMRVMVCVILIYIYIAIELLINGD